MAQLDWPFRGTEAIDAGLLSVRELRRFYGAAYPGVYRPRGVELSAIKRARAAWLWSRRRGTVAGLSAATVVGARWIDGRLPAELIHSNRRAPSMLIVHSDDLAAGETVLVDQMAVTTPARTAFDIGRRLPLTEAVQRIDALMHATDIKAVDIEAVIDRHPGVRGLAQLRRTLQLVDGGAESPYESLTRLLLVQAGFPVPQTQIPVIDDFGAVFARVDMGWPRYLVGVEFDGTQHWTNSRQRSWDIDRAAELSALGWTIVRVSSGMLHNTPQVVLARVRTALAGAGATW